jgi:hypothetical protein
MAAPGRLAVGFAIAAERGGIKRFSSPRKRAAVLGVRA